MHPKIKTYKFTENKKEKQLKIPVIRDFKRFLCLQPKNLFVLISMFTFPTGSKG
jgi:hypothetical protein